MCLTLLFTSHEAQGTAEPSALLLLLLSHPPVALFRLSLPSATLPTTHHLLQHQNIFFSASSSCAGPVPARLVCGCQQGWQWSKHLGPDFPREGTPAPAHLELHFCQMILDLSFSRPFAPRAADPQQWGPQHLSASLLESSFLWQHWLHRDTLGNKVPGAGQERDCGE